MSDDDARSTVDTGDDEPSRAGGRLVQVIAAIGPPLTVATALLLYFGWVRTTVEAETLGVNDTVFGYTTQDYVMRSINALFLPLVVAAVVGIGALLLHGWVMRGVDAGPTSRRHRATRAVAGVLLPACLAAPVLGALAEARRPDLTGLILPLAACMGVLLTSYAVTLRRRTSVDSYRWETSVELRRGRRIRVLIGVVVAATLFWWVGDFAGVVGRGLAYRIANDLGALPGVVIYSDRDLHLVGPGVGVERLSEDESAYAFRYDGLRLLERSDGRLFLLSDRWTIAEGTMFVIADDERVRIEYAHGPPAVS